MSMVVVCWVSIAVAPSVHARHSHAWPYEMEKKMASEETIQNVSPNPWCAP